LFRLTGRKTKQKKRGFLRRIVLGLSVAGMVAAIGGFAYAASLHSVQQTNILQSRDVSVKIDENFPDPTITPGETKTKAVAFTNTSSAPVFLRVSYAETWTNGGQWLPDDGSHAVKNWTPAWNADWVDGGDGWYYYKKVLAAGASTGDILSSVTFPPGLASPYADGQYSLSFTAEAVQLSDETLVNTQATQTVFGKTATVTITSTGNGAVTAGTVSWGG